MSRDPEQECWSAHDAAVSSDDLALRLKALELIVKIRCAGEKVKGDEKSPSRGQNAALTKVLAEVNKHG